MTTTDSETERFLKLTESGLLTPEKLREAAGYAEARGLELESVLLKEFGVPRRELLHALSKFYKCPSTEYDERMQVPPELLAGLDGERLYLNKWFPIIKDGERVIIAANAPDAFLLTEEIRRFIKAKEYEFRVTTAEDIRWFILDFLHAKPGHLIGTERTNLAFWRHTMSHWRTRLACNRNDLSHARTGLAFLRWGLGIIALAQAMIRSGRAGYPDNIYWIMIFASFPLILYGLISYGRIRKSVVKPSAFYTLIETTASVLHFLEGYHRIDGATQPGTIKKTVLGRIGDRLADHCTILYPSPASKERTQLARERNVLAGQRTVAACYRTIYARARTGLSLIRTGVAFSSLGIGLISYFGSSIFSVPDYMLIAAGILMMADGALWYMPVIKETAELPRCNLSQL